MRVLSNGKFQIFDLLSSFIGCLILFLIFLFICKSLLFVGNVDI